VVGDPDRKVGAALDPVGHAAANVVAAGGAATPEGSMLKNASIILTFTVLVCFP
jgi:hypothetical protein